MESLSGESIERTYDMKLPENLPMPNHMAKSEILHLLLAEEYGFLLGYDFYRRK